MRKQVFSILVDNNPGVTSRISGLFTRRGYNIDSFTSGPTEDPRVARITIVSTGEEQILTQIEKQLSKLEDVRKVEALKDDEFVYRELVLVNVRVDAAHRAEVVSLVDIFRAKVVDVEKECMMIELTGTQSKLDAFLDLIKGYEIIDLARTGITALTKGNI